MRKLIHLSCYLIFTIIACILVIIFNIHGVWTILIGMVFGSLGSYLAIKIINKIEAEGMK